MVQFVFYFQKMFFYPLYLDRTPSIRQIPFHISPSFKITNRINNNGNIGLPQLTYKEK